MRKTDAVEISADDPTVYLCDTGSGRKRKNDFCAAVHHEPLLFFKNKTPHPDGCGVLLYDDQLLCFRSSVMGCFPK